MFEDNDVFGTQSLKGNLTAFTSAREKGLDGLLRSLSSRFADIEEGVLEAAQIASLQNWPDADGTGGEYLEEIFSWQNHIKVIEM